MNLSKNQKGVTCNKIGIKIHESKNDYKVNPFLSTNSNQINNKSNEINKSNGNINKTSEKNSFDTLDLDIDNYSLNELFHLFGIEESILTDEIMKRSKQKVLKVHPDKSQLDSKFFLFFSKAYKKLYTIYEFQNKSTKKEIKLTDFFNESNNNILNNIFEKNKFFEKSEEFNKWFNEKFEKYKLDDSTDSGYGDWLKSEEGIYDTSHVTKANMKEEFEKQKKQIQSLCVYNGINDNYSSALGGSILGSQNNYTSFDGNGYTDLKQAYEESVIPVTDDDYNNMPKFRNIEEYKNHRSSVNINPIDKELSMKKLYKQNELSEQQSMATAFQLAQQTEKAEKQKSLFWAELKQLTNY